MLPATNFVLENGLFPCSLGLAYTQLAEDSDSMFFVTGGYFSCSWYTCEECGTDLLPWTWGGECSFRSIIWAAQFKHAKWRKLS